MAAMRATVRSAVVVVALLVAVAPLRAQQAPAQQAPAQQALTVEEQEAFLKNAKLGRARGVSKGVTSTQRITLTDGPLTHDASVQTIDQFMQTFQSKQGIEFNFRDSWRYNIAAYRLNKVLQLGRIPPSVERSFNGKVGSFTWWIDDVLMDEGERIKTRAKVPDTDAWNRQMWHVRVFDQLIYNVDRNLGNLVIDKDWNIWMIDHSRAFRLIETLKSPGDLKKIERSALARLKQLDAASLKAAVGNYLTPDEQKRLLVRRDALVKLFEAQGEEGVFDAPSSQ